jgi:hypothetical protein
MLPPNPQACEVTPVSQTEPLQHPVQLSGEQARVVQIWSTQIERGTSHARHSRPPDPQARCAVPGWQTSS